MKWIRVQLPPDVAESLCAEIDTALPIEQRDLADFVVDASIILPIVSFVGVDLPATLSNLKAVWKCVAMWGAAEESAGEAAETNPVIDATCGQSSIHLEVADLNAGIATLAAFFRANGLEVEGEE